MKSVADLENILYCSVVAISSSVMNLLKIGGGGYTLSRIKLHNAALQATDIADFMDRVLPYYMNLLLELIDRRIRFMIEESVFFDANFLVTEGFIEREKFTGMVGVVGLAECVNTLLNIEDPKKGFGNNPQGGVCSVL